MTIKNENKDIQLNMDRIILGTAGLAGIWGQVNKEESLATLKEALSLGIRALDTAPAYGDGEKLVGELLSGWQGEKPIVSTKVGRKKGYKADEAYYDYSASGMLESVQRSLQTIGIQSVDVLFLHDPAAISAQDVQEVTDTMQTLKAKGYAKRICIGGNTPDYFAPYLQSGVFDVIMEHNRLNACNIDAINDTLLLCEAQNKEYYAASPLNMGLLGRNFVGFSMHPPAWLDPQAVSHAKKINVIAEENSVSIQELALRFLLGIPADFKIVLGAANLGQLRDSLEIIRKGELPAKVYNDIILTFNK